MSTEAATDPDARRLLDPSLFVRVDDAAAPWRLVGSRCGTCGAVTFPAQASCPRCTGGTCPPTPSPTAARCGRRRCSASAPRRRTSEPTGRSAPFGVGYVDLAGEVIVEARLSVTPSAADRRAGAARARGVAGGRRRAGVDVRVSARRDRSDGAPVSERRRHRRRRHPPVRPHRRRQRPRAGRGRRPGGAGRRRHRLGRRAGRLRRELRRRQRRRARRRPRPDRHRVRQRAQRLRHRRQRAGDGRPRRSAPAPTTWRWPSASTSTRRERSTPTPPSTASAHWYGETGMMLTTQFFAMKIQRYLHEHDIDPRGAVDDRRQGVPQRRAATRTPGGARRCRWRRSPASAMVSDPLTKYMFCSPAEGAVALVLCRG